MTDAGSASEADAGDNRRNAKRAAAHTAELIEPNPCSELAQTNACLAGEGEPRLARRFVARSFVVTAQPRSDICTNVRRDRAG